MPKIRMTHATLEKAAKAPAEGATDYFDSAHAGLSLRVTAAGVRTWTLFARVHGIQKRVKLGRWPELGIKDARAKAGETVDRMRAGVDPPTERRAEAEARAAGKGSVRAAVADWLKRDQSGHRGFRGVARLFERVVLPAWGDRQLADIRKRDVIELIDVIADRGKGPMANRTLAHVKRFTRWCCSRDLLEADPAAFVEKPAAEVKRDRVLTDDELRRVWQAAGAAGWPFGSCIQLLALTGARREEIRALRWAEVDLDERTIRLAAERTKTSEPRLIPLAPAAVELLRGLPRIEGGLVFTTTGRTPISGWSRTKRNLDRASGVNGWRLHDLRRTVATGLQRQGVRLEVVETILGHVAGSRAGVVGIYQRYRFEPEARAALEGWASHVERLTTASATSAPALVA